MIHLLLIGFDHRQKLQCCYYAVPGPELFQSPEIVSAEEATGFKIPLLEDIVTFTKSLDVSG